MTDQKEHEYQNYIRALEAENQDLKSDLSKAMNVVYGILEAFGVDPEKIEEFSLKKLIKTGSGMFTQALIQPEAFAKRFHFVTAAIDLAKKHHQPTNSEKNEQ